MKIKIELDDGYEEVFEVDEENDEIEDLGTTKEMMQARIKELEDLNCDKSVYVAFYQEANKACQKEINALHDKVNGWEKRCGELEQELRDAQNRIHEQDWTIGCYDQENQELKNENAELSAALTSKTQEVNGLQGTVAAQRVWFCGGQLQINKNTFNDWAKRIHEIAVSHGWWESEDGKCDDGDRPFPEIVALCHSELSEAMEEYRNDKPMAYQVQSYGIVEGRVENDPAKWFPASKPEGIAVEMIDCVIRILDWMGHEGIDVDTLMEKKVKYNEGRKHRHGGKKA